MSQKWGTLRTGKQSAMGACMAGLSELDKTLRELGLNSAELGYALLQKAAGNAMLDDLSLLEFTEHARQAYFYARRTTNTTGEP